MTNKKRIISILVALAVLSTSLLLGLPTVVSGDVWDGSASSSLEGSGTAEEPYLIKTGADLAYFAGSVNGGNDYTGKYLKLTADIDLNDLSFSPIGNTGAYFRGNFDGDKHTVSGLNISSSSDRGIGFFGAVHNSTVKNITVKGSVRATVSVVAVAGLIGVAAGTVSITNCVFDGTVRALNTLISNGAGGWSTNEQNYSSASGLVCRVEGNTTVNHCCVSGVIDGFGRSGGLVGSVNGPFSLAVTNSYCDANVTGKGALDDSLSGYLTAGGLFGFLNTGTIVSTNCFFAGTAAPARSSGMGGPIINHYAGGTFTCVNTFYIGNAKAESGSNEFGTFKTAAEFANGTVTDLLNDDDDIVFVQGEAYPVFAIDDCSHADVTEEWLFDDNNHWHKCNICGRKVDKGAHTPGSFIVDTYATPETDGTTHRECTVCGKVTDTGTFAYGGWDGTVSDSLEGAGTSKDPYLIKNGSDLAYLSEQVNAGVDYSGKYIALAGDINMNGLSFTPIGNNPAYFRGNFNGNNYTVSGINIESNKNNGIGFFGALAGVVENLNVKGSVTATEPKVAVAGIAGIAAGAAIRHCSFDGTVTSVFPDDSNRWNYLCASGLVSNVAGGLSIDQCSVSGTINGFGRGGGLVGSVNGGFTVSVLNSYCDANIIGEGSGYATAVNRSTTTSGGLLGFLANGSITLENCFFTGTAPEARAAGMCGPIINHYHTGTLACKNVYYIGDKQVEIDGQEFGTYKTAAQFADGTVLALINSDPDNPVFEQTDSAPYPTLGAKYIKKVNKTLKEYTFEDHPGTVEKYDADTARYTDDGFFKNTDPDKSTNDPDYYYIGARLFNYGAWNNSKIHIPQAEYANESKYGVGFSLMGGATFINIPKTDIDPELFYTLTVDAKVIKTVPDAVVQIGLFRPNAASGTLAFQDSDGNTYDTAIKAVKLKLDKKTGYTTYKIEISGEEILEFCGEYSFSANSLFFGIYSPQFIGKNKEEYSTRCVALDNFKVVQSAVPAGYVPMAAVAATDLLDESLKKNYGEHLYNFIENPSFENAMTGVWANLPAGVSVKTAGAYDAMFGRKFLRVSGGSKVSVPVNLVKNKFYTFGISVRGANGSAYKVYLSDAPYGAPLGDIDEPTQKFLIAGSGTGKAVRYGIYFRNTMKSGTTLYLVLESVKGTVDFDEITLTNKTGWEKNKNYYPKNENDKVSVVDNSTGKEKVITVPSGKSIYDLIK